MLTLNLDKLGRTMLTMALLVLPLGAAACDSQGYEIDESSIRSGDSADPSVEASGATALAAGDYLPAAPCCSICPEICDRYGFESLQCQRCEATCIDCLAAGADCAN
jgi:hypothetical protein